jgi:hypothetical protein
MAPFNAKGTTDAAVFVYRDLVVGVLDEGSADRVGRTTDIFSRRCVASSLVSEQPKAELAVSALSVGMNTLHGGWL